MFPAFDAARNRELSAWREHGVHVKTKRPELPNAARPIRTRWVYTENDGDVKARLNSRGDIESRRDKADDLGAEPSDSPTVSKKGFRIFFAFDCLV